MLGVFSTMVNLRPSGRRVSTGRKEHHFAIQTALEAGGVEFIDSDTGGPGVRLKPNP